MMRRLGASEPPVRYLSAIIRSLGYDPSEPATPSSNGYTLTKSPQRSPCAVIRLWRKIDLNFAALAGTMRIHRSREARHEHSS